MHIRTKINGKSYRAATLDTLKFIPAIAGWVIINLSNEDNQWRDARITVTAEEARRLAHALLHGASEADAKTAAEAAAE